MMTSRERSTGALLGLALGDAVGTTLEFRSPGTFEPIDDLIGGGPFGLKPGEWTDDTTMAMCLGESILDTGELDLADQLRRYLLWRDEGYWSVKDRCFDIGNATSAALARFARDGSVVDAVIDEEAAANGSLMRLAPVPTRWHQDVGLAAEKSAESSRTTHPARRPVDACRVYGAMTAALIGGAAPDEVLSPEFWQWGELDPQIEAVVRGSWRTKSDSEIRGTGFVVDALEAALWAVGGANSFADAVLRAANLGDDADTTAAIAGQLAGAIWGESEMPTQWLAKLAQRDRIRAVAARLHDQAVGATAAQPWPFDQFVHGYWIEPGRVLAGEYPGDPSAGKADAKVNLLVDNGVRTFVNLTTEHDPLAPYDHYVALAGIRRNLDLRVVSHGIPDMGVRPAESYDEIIETIRAESERGVVYVHCWGGIGRTATVAGCLLVDGGMSSMEALDFIRAQRSVTRKAHREAPQTPAQRRVIERRAR